jgi:hypothetical protein
VVDPEAEEQRSRGLCTDGPAAPALVGADVVSVPDPELELELNLELDLDLDLKPEDSVLFARRALFCRGPGAGRSTPRASAVSGGASTRLLGIYTAPS